MNMYLTTKVNDRALEREKMQSLSLPISFGFVEPFTDLGILLGWQKAWGLRVTDGFKVFIFGKLIIQVLQF